MNRTSLMSIGHQPIQYKRSTMVAFTRVVYPMDIHLISAKPKPQARIDKFVLCLKNKCKLDMKIYTMQKARSVPNELSGLMIDIYCTVDSESDHTGQLPQLHHRPLFQDLGRHLHCLPSHDACGFRHQPLGSREWTHQESEAEED